MNRLEKKCFLASMAAHGLLVLVLLLAPAFLVPEKKLPDEPFIDILPIPQNILDELRASGTPGLKPHDMKMAPQPAIPNTPPTPSSQIAPPPPAAQKAKAAPPEPQPAPEPPPQIKKVVSPIPKIEDDAKKPSKTKTEPTKEPSKSTVKVELKSQVVELGKSKKDSKSDSKQASKDEDSKSKAQQREARRIAGIADKQAELIENALNGLRKNLTGSTEIYVPGDGSGIYATYSQVVKSVYDRAWVFTDDIADLRMSVEATITIARDGTVISARIKRKSGTGVLDNSVLKVLRDVKYIAPFPEGSKEVERTFELNFNPATKRATG